MAVSRKPVVFDETQNQHRAAIPGVDDLDGDFVKISTDKGNSLQLGEDGGLFVDVSKGGGISDVATLISSEQPNSLQKSSVDNRLRVPVVTPASFVSGDVPNALKMGTDNKLLVQNLPANTMVSDDPNNLLSVGTDSKLFARQPVAGDFVSGDAGNRLGVGANDPRLFVAKTPAQEYVSENANNAITVGTDNKLYAKMLNAAGMVSAEDGNDLLVGTDGKLFISVQDKVTIDGTDTILTKSIAGIKGNVSLNYVSSTRTVQLIGKGNAVISSIQLPETAVLENAGVVTDPAGQPAGTYLALTFTTTTGSETVYVNMDRFITVYTAGDASVDVTNFQIRARLDPNSALNLGENGIGLTITGLISADAGNELSAGVDGKLRVTHKPLSEYISGNEGNVLTVGSDNKYFVPTPEISRDNLQTGGGLTVDGDGNLLVQVGDLIAASTGSAPNLITVNGNKLLVLPASAVSTVAGNFLTTASDGKLYVGGDNLISGNANNALVKGTDNKLFVPQASIPTAGAATATVNGPNAGVITLAADTNTTSRNLAATPAGVAAQIAPVAAAVAQAGKVETVNHIAADTDKNVQTTFSVTQAQFNSMKAAGTLVREAMYIITDGSGYDNYTVDVNAAGTTIALRNPAGNLRAAGLEKAAGTPIDYRGAFPSGEKVSMTLPASGGTITTPGDGWMLMIGHNVAASLGLVNLGYLTGVDDERIASQGNAYSTDTASVAMLPVKRGFTVYTSYFGVKNIGLWFVPASGGGV